MTAKILFLDIETMANAGYFWGLFNQNLSIDKIVKPGRTLCAAWKWSDSKKVEFSAEWHDPEDYMFFLKDLYRVLDEADIVVTYNGKKFDIPTLYKEFVQFGFGPPAPFHHIDLYQTVKRQFRFASSKLDFVCQQLGLGAKVHTKGMQLWKDVDTGCPKAQKEMEKYNRMDVVLLEKLYKRLLPWIKSHPSVPLLSGDSSIACPSCGSHHVQERGWRTTKTRRYKRLFCTSCGAWSSSSTADREFKTEVTSL